jgi:K+-transporting ATPase ATPase C chain
MSGDARPSAAPSPPPLAALLRQLRPAVVGLAVLTLLTGAIYPALLLGIGRLFFASQASGSLVTRDGEGVVGSRLIGQAFARPEYFQPRPSAAGAGYDASQSSGTNLSPSNPKLIASIGDAAAAYRKLNGLGPTAAVPIDAVTSSASGLDPEISPENAALQAPRVARARGVEAALVRQLVAANTRGPDFGLLGAPRVSVLALNLALDGLAPEPER